MTRDVDAGAVERLPRCPHGREAIALRTFDGGFTIFSDNARCCGVGAGDEAAARRAWHALCGSPQAQAVKVPSVVGFYWVRMYEDEWTVARVYATACVPGGLVAKAGIGTFAVDAPALTDWHGPLATPQAPEGA